MGYQATVPGIRQHDPCATACKFRSERRQPRHAGQKPNQRVTSVSVLVDIVC